MHDVLAATVEYCPATQLEHVAAVLAPTAVEYVTIPVAQLEHIVAPVELKYFPAVQAVQAVPLVAS